MKLNPTQETWMNQATQAEVERWLAQQDFEAEAVSAGGKWVGAINGYRLTEAYSSMFAALDAVNKWREETLAEYPPVDEKESGISFDNIRLRNRLENVRYRVEEVIHLAVQQDKPSAALRAFFKEGLAENGHIFGFDEQKARFLGRKTTSEILDVLNRYNLYGWLLKISQPKVVGGSFNALLLDKKERHNIWFYAEEYSHLYLLADQWSKKRIETDLSLL